MKPKLLITTDCFLPRWDGISRFLNELLPPLQEVFQITVVAPKFKGEYAAPEGITIIRIPLMFIRFGDIYFSWFQKRKIRKLLQEHDLVFNQTIGPIGLTAITQANKLQKKVVTFVHSIEWELASESMKYFKKFIKKFVKNVVHKMYNKCSVILVPSPQVKELLTLNNVITCKKVVKLGIDPDKFVPPLMKSKAKEAIGISSKKKVIGYVGRLGREKDLGTLKNAFIKISKQFPDSILLLIGAGIEQNKLQGKNIFLVGAQKNVHLLLQAMDVYVLPSLTETSSLSTMEAMSSGLPVVVTPVGSLQNYVVDGKNGMFFPKKNTSVLAEKLVLLLNNMPLRAALGRSARKTIIDKHHWDITVKNITTILLENIKTPSE
jgi:glycosyltransferase involved in cell wall biosynthesis